MLGTINKAFNHRKSDIKNDKFIMESVMDVEEVLPGSDEELDDIVDSDSIPADVMEKVDAALDKLIDSEDFDDEEIEEMLDDDIDDVDEDDVIDVAISEAAGEYWEDNENISHPDEKRKEEVKDQPEFQPEGEDTGKVSQVTVTNESEGASTPADQKAEELGAEQDKAEAAGEKVETYEEGKAPAAEKEVLNPEGEAEAKPLKESAAYRIAKEFGGRVLDENNVVIADFRMNEEGCPLAAMAKEDIACEDPSDKCVKDSGDDLDKPMEEAEAEGEKQEKSEEGGEIPDAEKEVLIPTITESTVIMDMRALAAGYDQFMIECFGGASLMKMNTILEEAAKSQQFAILRSPEYKEMNAEIKVYTKAYRKKDYKAAIESAQKVVKLAKTLKGMAAKIDDDTKLGIFIESVVRALVAAAGIVGVLGGIKLSAGDSAIKAMLGGIVTGVSYGTSVVSAAGSPSGRTKEERIIDKYEANNKDGKHQAFTRNQMMKAFDASIKAYEEAIKKLKKLDAAKEEGITR